MPFFPLALHFTTFLLGQAHKVTYVFKLFFRLSFFSCYYFLPAVIVLLLGIVSGGDSTNYVLGVLPVQKFL